MAVSCRACPLRKLDTFDPMSPEDVNEMERFKAGELSVEKGTPLMMEGANSPQLYTALSGMGLRYKTLEDGRRQVLNFVFPGDFIGLQAASMGEMKHSVETVTAMKLCVFDRKAFWEFLRRNSRRAYDLIWLAAVEEHFLGETIASIGQRSARERIAWALVRVFQRGRALGLVNDGEMRFPFKQQDLADALGLSLVHTNKTLGRLREGQLASWQEGWLRVPDIERLARAGRVDDLDTPSRPLM